MRQYTHERDHTAKYRFLAYLGYNSAQFINTEAEEAYEAHSSCGFSELLPRSSTIKHILKIHLAEVKLFLCHFHLKGMSLVTLAFISHLEIYIYFFHHILCYYSQFLFIQPNKYNSVISVP